MILRKCIWYPKSIYLQIIMNQDSKTTSKPKATKENLRSRLETIGRNGRNRADKTVKHSRETIQKRPLSSVGAGVAAGAIVGVVAATLLTRRKKSNAR
jgi:ElaB/YqjD/DUF883 family membrane-anchored ribosome-binding protein